MPLSLLEPDYTPLLPGCPRQKGNCLLREFEMDLLTPLRRGASLEELRHMVLEAVWQKPWGHGLASTAARVRLVDREERVVN